MPSLIKLSGSQWTDDPRLDRIKPPDWEHFRKYPLTLEIAETLEPTPVVFGIDWYEAFDKPERYGRSWWIGRDLSKLGAVRGGHAICAKPYDVNDSWYWYQRYDQGNEGACVGFSSSRAMSLTHRVLLDAPWLYHEAQKVDEWPGESYSGTSVRAGFDVLKTQGHRRINGKTYEPSLSLGVKEFRWALDAQDVLKALGSDKQYVTLLNSWGNAYPKAVRMPAECVQYLLSHEGEACVPVFTESPASP